MDVTQRLDEIRQMAIGLRELGLAPESHGHLLAALYFCEGVTALPVVIGQWQEDFMEEVQAGRQSLREAIEKVQTDVSKLRHTVLNALGEHTGMLQALGEANEVETQALTRLITGRGGTYETVPDRQEEAEHANGQEGDNTREATSPCHDAERSADRCGEGP